MRQVKVLLVDDEMEFAETLAERLRLRSFEVTVASRANEALTAIDEGLRPDVVLMDIKMPGLDGMDALKDIRERNPRIETIILTGHGAMESSVEGMKLGAFDYLMKPVDIAELIAKIEQAVDKSDRAENIDGGKGTS